MTTNGIRTVRRATLFLVLLSCLQLLLLKNSGLECSPGELRRIDVSQRDTHSQERGYQQEGERGEEGRSHQQPTTGLSSRSVHGSGMCTIATGLVVSCALLRTVHTFGFCFCRCRTEVYKSPTSVSYAASTARILPSDTHKQVIVRAERAP